MMTNPRRPHNRTISSFFFGGSLEWRITVETILLVVAVCNLILPLTVVESSSVPCRTNEDCLVMLEHATGAGASINPSAPIPSLAECGENGFCTNPYQNGCLVNRLPGWTRLRTCNSDDPENASDLGRCSLPKPGFEHMEIRIASQNWESVFFEAWILQILLSEMLDIPVTIETGYPDKSVNLYDPQSRMDYGDSNLWNSLERGVELGDCRKRLKRKNNNNNTEDGEYEYQPCAHVIPEMWSGSEAMTQRYVKEAIIEPTTSIGVVGFETWFVPRFTAERDQTLVTHLGLSGESNRRKLAERFKRPTTWQDYCDFVSSDNCLTDDGIAQRPPLDESEYDRMFVEGVYTGHFRMTDENDCDRFPHNCTGHIVDYPCGWTSYVLPQTYHLNIALASSGKEPGSKGYSYGQMVEIWHAANATKSDIMLQWWLPEPLYSLFLHTDAEFQQVNLPPADQECISNRVNVEKKRCGDYTFEEKVGNPLGACGDSPVPIKKIVGSRFYSDTHNPNTPEVLQSPGYDVVKNFRISNFQLDEIFDYWLEAGFDKWNFDPRDATCRWVVDNFEELQQFVPQTYPRVLEDAKDGDSIWLAYTSFILGGLATSGVLVAFAAMFRQKNRTNVMSAQVEFLFLLLAGLFLVAMSSMLQSIQPTDARCVAVIWLSNLGYTLQLVPLIVKIGAINRLMRAARRMKRVVLPRKKLFGVVALLVAIVVVFLILWTLLDPPQRETIHTLSERTTDGETIVFADYYCETRKFAGWHFVSLAAEVVLLMIASVYAFQTRNLNQLSQGLNETKTLAMLIYSHFVFVMARCAVFIFANSLGVVVAAHIISVLYSLDSIATLVIYFLPKFITAEHMKSVKKLYGLSIPVPPRQSVFNGDLESHITSWQLNEGSTDDVQPLSVPHQCEGTTNGHLPKHSIPSLPVASKGMKNTPSNDGGTELEGTRNGHLPKPSIPSLSVSFKGIKNTPSNGGGKELGGEECVPPIAMVTSTGEIDIPRRSHHGDTSEDSWIWNRSSVFSESTGSVEAASSEMSLEATTYTT